MRGRRRRGGNYALIMLAVQLARSGWTGGPATLGAMALNVGLHYGNVGIHSITQICLGSSYAWFYGQWYRLLTAAFFHADDMHLYYNMTSLLWKGRRLEPMLGTVRMIWCMLCFAIMGNALFLGAAVIGFRYEVYPALMSQCMLGFSGVIFALKTVLYGMSPNDTSRLMGIPISTRHLAWAELVFISVISPRASFAGHLCGILVGMIYLTGRLEWLFGFPEKVIRLGVPRGAPVPAPGGGVRWGYEAAPQAEQADAQEDERLQQQAQRVPPPEAQDAAQAAARAAMARRHRAGLYAYRGGRPYGCAAGYGATIYVCV